MPAPRTRTTGIALAILLALTATAQAQWRPDPAAAAAEAAIGRFGPASFSRANCTAVLVAPDAVLTAWHCIGRAASFGAWADGAPLFAPPRVAAIPAAGWLGHRPRPGPVQAADAARVTLTVPATAGPLPFTEPRPPEPMIAIGYPRALAGRVQRLNCTALERQGDILLLDCPVTSGMSGAPVLALRGGTWHIAGVLVASLSVGAARAMAMVPAADGFAPPPLRVAPNPGSAGAVKAP